MVVILSIAIENLKRDLRMRVESDKEMSVGWLLVPFSLIAGAIGSIAIYVFVFLTFLSSITFGPNGTPTSSTPPPGALAAIQTLGLVSNILGWVLLAVVIAYIVMLYKMVKRRNTHFARQFLLYEDLIVMAREIAGRKSVDISLPLNNLDRSVREARTEETEKSAVLWAILAVVPVINFFANPYIGYFLMKDFFKHERREDLFIDDLNRALAAMGTRVNLPPRTVPIPDRSFVLYLILSILTVGLFGIYWVYVLITDPNNHFRQQWMIEDTLLAQAAPILTPSAQPSPSALTTSYTLPPSSYTSSPPLSGPDPGPGPAPPP